MFLSDQNEINKKFLAMAEEDEELEDEGLDESPEEDDELEDDDLDIEDDDLDWDDDEDLGEDEGGEEDW